MDVVGGYCWWLSFLQQRLLLVLVPLVLALVQALPLLVKVHVGWLFSGGGQNNNDWVADFVSTPL